MTRPTDPLFDQRIADWLEGDPRHAPGQVLDTVLAALPSIPRRRVSRVPWRFTTMPTLTRLAAAAFIGLLAVGGALYLIQPGKPAVAGPSPTPSASSSPSDSASPSAGPSPTIVQPRAASWTVTGSMGTPRARGTATLLPDGKVLVAGGAGSNNGNDITASAELYDPTTGSWTATETMAIPRVNHTATLLPDGKVLVAGGFGDGGALASAELYDPGTGSWTATGSMGTPRQGDTATLLPDGKVLVAGGDTGSFPSDYYLASAELYDPGTGSWTATGTMTTPREGHTATLLPDGKVLVADGDEGSGNGNDAELYDPTTGSWTATGTTAVPRYGHTATLLPDGKVLVAGGAGSNGAAFIGWASAELYDPTTGSWTATGTMATPRADHTATLLPDGKVLVAGDLASAELYDPTTGSWTATGTMGTPRSGATATLLPDGKVLVAGGDVFSGGVMSPLATAELYDPGSGG